MDRRLTPFSGRVALQALRGQVEAVFVPGEAGAVAVPLADLCASPFGARDRQVEAGFRWPDAESGDAMPPIVAEDGLLPFAPGWEELAWQRPAGTPLDAASVKALVRDIRKLVLGRRAVAERGH
mgnify:CR=1 FL=1